MNKGFWAVVAAIVIVFGGILWFKGNNKANAPSNGAQPTNHIEGLGQKHVTLVEYGDYECPYCEQYYPVMKQIAASYNNEIVFQFRNLPLTQIHPNAFAGARAAEAAALQNKFWQMHDMLYDGQNQWVNTSDPTPYFNQYAAQLGLNVNKFKTDFAGAQVNTSINADVAAFNKTGNDLATPTFFLDGKKINPGLSFDSDGHTVNVPSSAALFSKLIDQQIAAKNSPAVTPGGSQHPQ